MQFARVDEWGSGRAAGADVGLERVSRVRLPRSGEFVRIPGEQLAIVPTIRAGAEQPPNVIVAEDCGIEDWQPFDKSRDLVPIVEAWIGPVQRDLAGFVHFRD